MLDTKEKLLEKEFDNIDEFIEYFYFYTKLHDFSESFEKALLEKNNKFNLNLDQLQLEIEKFHDAFMRKIKVVADKVIKSPSIRKLTKEIAKEVGNVSSQTYIKKQLSIKFSLTVSKISDLKYQMLFDDQTIDQLFELILNDHLLKKEFIGTAVRLLKDVSLHMNDNRSNFEHCSTTLIAKFYIDYYENQSHLSTELKKQIHSLITMSNDDIRILSNKFNEKITNEETITLENNKQEVSDCPIEEIDLLPQDNRLNQSSRIRKITISQEDFCENAETMFMIFKKTKDILNKYFLVEDDEDHFKEAVNRNHDSYLNFKNSETNNFILKCKGYLSNVFMLDENDSGGEDEIKTRQYMIVIDFMLFLAHSLLDGPQDFKNELLELCQTFLNKNLIVANNYSELMHHLEVQPHVLMYTPSQLYDCVCVISVFKEIDNDKTITKRIKRLLIKYYKDVYADLANVNYEDENYYFDHLDSKLDDIFIHHYAITFMFNYFKDPIYLAPLSALIYKFEDMMFKGIEYYDHNETMIQRVCIDSEIDNIGILERALDYYNEISYFIENIDNYDLEEIKDDLSKKYQLLFVSSIQRNFFYDVFLDCSYMLKKYQKNLAFILGYDGRSYSMDYDPWSDEEKIELLWELAINISLIQEIYTSDKFLPKAVDLSIDDYTRNLEKSNEELKQQIQNKDTEILTLKNHIKSLNGILQKENNIKNNELTKNYNKEIHVLNKELIQKDKKIEKLKENQEELYKLRSLMFSLENNQEQEFNDTINYEAFLSDITQKKKIIFIGGHINLIKVLKAKYPNMFFITNENLISHQVIDHADYIFFFYNFLNHTLYYKAMGLLHTQSKIKWDYISSRNLNLVEKDLYQKLTK